MYGFFGVKTGYYPITDIAAAVTAEGRRIITIETKTKIEELGYKVIYGDTVRNALVRALLVARDNFLTRACVGRTRSWCCWPA